MNNIRDLRVNVSESIYWTYIGGHQWSLVETYEHDYDKHVCSVEIEPGKAPTIAYVSRPLTVPELEQLMKIVTDENYE